MPDHPQAVKLTSLIVGAGIACWSKEVIDAGAIVCLGSFSPLGG